MDNEQATSETNGVALHNSVRTIEHRVSAILAKHGLRNRAEAAVYAAAYQANGSAKEAAQ